MPQTAELSWYLSCFFPFQQIGTLAHSFKDKADRLENVNAGLFTYPMLDGCRYFAYMMPSVVPVGKDQMQHIEFTRDVASRFNHQMGETFVIARRKSSRRNYAIFLEPMVNKMSKSRGNIID